MADGIDFGWWRIAELPNGRWDESLKFTNGLFMSEGSTRDVFSGIKANSISVDQIESDLIVQYVFLLGTKGRMEKFYLLGLPRFVQIPVHES